MTDTKPVGRALSAVPSDLDATAGSDGRRRILTGRHEATPASLHVGGRAGSPVAAWPRGVPNVDEHGESRERHPSNQGPREADGELIDARTTQAELIALLAHDTRQPLSVIRGYLEITIDGWADTSEEIKLHQLGRAAQATRALAELIEDLLTLTGLDAGTVTAHRAQTHVADVVQHSVLNSGHPQEITIEITGRPTVQIDAWQLTQIISNLVGNAVRHGRGPVRVTATDHGETALVTVEDSGKGVADTVVQHLFTRSAAESGESTNANRSKGFGLYIVGRLVELNHGTVTYRPNQPTGAVFTVVLPSAIKGE